MESLNIQDDIVSKILKSLKQLNANRNKNVIREIEKDEEILQNRIKHERKKYKYYKLADISLSKTKKDKKTENIDKESDNIERDDQFDDEVTEEKFEESYAEEYDIDNFEG